MEITRDVTGNGYTIYEFYDNLGTPCNLQESSAAHEPAIWIGRTGHPRMSLNQEQATVLLPLLQYFVNTGELP